MLISDRVRGRTNGPEVFEAVGHSLRPSKMLQPACLAAWLPGYLANCMLVLLLLLLLLAAPRNTPPHKPTYPPTYLRDSEAGGGLIVAGAEVVGDSRLALRTPHAEARDLLTDLPRECEGKHSASPGLVLESM